MNAETRISLPVQGTPPRYAGLWLALIMLLGFGLRFTGLHWGQAYSWNAQGDGIAAYLTAVDFERGEPLAQYIGQPNFNEHSKLPGPLWTLFCVAGLRFRGSIEGVIWAVILLNTATVYLVYQLTGRTVGSPAALWAALLTATLPWVVNYSVAVYNPDVMPFLGALLFLALWEVTQRERSRAVFWVVLLMLAMPQFHMSGLMLIPAVVMVLWLSPARLSFPWLIGGLVAGIALYWPYLHGEMLHGWQNSRGWLAGGRSGHAVESLKALSAPLSFLVNWVPRWTQSAEDYRELGRSCFGSFYVFLALNVLSMVFAGFLVLEALQIIKLAFRGFWRAPRAAFTRSPGIIFLTLVFCVPLLCALVSGTPFHSRYCLVLLAPQIALAAAAAGNLLNAPRAGRIFPPVMAVTILANIWLMPAMYWAQGRRIERGPLFVPSFRKLESVYQGLKAHAGANRFVRVEVAAYHQSSPPDDKSLHQAELISDYVAVREAENGLPADVRTSPLIYKLSFADQVEPGDPAVAYRKSGIALVARPDVK